MPTIDDLRDAFAARAQDAPRVPDLLASLPDPVRHRGRAVAAATAALATAAAVVTAAALTGTGAGRPAASSPTPSAPAAHTADATPTTGRPGPTPTRLQFAFRLGRVPGYTLQYSAVEAHDQVADVYAVGRSVKSVGDIRVYSPGAYDPSAARAHGTPVTVSGHPGYWAELVDPDTTDGHGGGTAMWAVVWEYAPNAWAVVQGDWAWEVAHGYLTGDPEQTELAVAEAVDTTATHRLPVPIRLTYLPAGLVVQSAGFAPDDSQAQVGLTDGGASDPSYPGNTDTVAIQVNRYDPVVDFRKTDAHGNFWDPGQGGSTIGFGRPVHVAGARAFQDTSLATVTVLYGDRYVTVAYTGTSPRRVSDAELLRIAQGIRNSLALHDRSTWFDGLTIGP